MGQEAWTIVGWVLGGAVAAIGGLKGAQAIQERRKGNGNGHSPSPSTIRLQVADDAWRARVSHDLFDGGDGTVRGRFHDIYDRQLSPMSGRITMLERDRESDRAQIADLRDDVRRIESRAETIQAMSIETNVLVKELRTRRRADREE